MGDEKKPELTPQDHEKKQAETASQIEGQFGATDALERFATVMDKIGFGNAGGLFGKTSFEEVQLNAMLDLLEASNPSDLERAGENLEKARVALNKAAKDLDDFVKKTDWKGEGATEFQRYGSELAGYAWKLGAFANVVGTQMTVASTGLTSVKNSMPRERDTRLIAKKPEAFALAPAKDTNPEYIEAVKVEKNRQEAINQMNRLSSFYAVSEQSLAQQQPPEMPKMLKAAVPRPADRPARHSSRLPRRQNSDSVSAVSQQLKPSRAEVADTEGTARTEADGVAKPTPTPETSMEIDSVVTPPAPTTGPGPAQPVTATGTPSTTGGGPVPPMTSGFANPVKGGTARSVGTSGGPRAGGGGTSSPVGRATGGNGSPSVGRSGTAGNAGPVGRPGATGTGTPARTRRRDAWRDVPVGAVAGGQSPVTGRAGAAGQPTAGRAGTRGFRAQVRTSRRHRGRDTAAHRRWLIRFAYPSRHGHRRRGAHGRAFFRREAQSVWCRGRRPAQSAARPAGRGTPSSNGVVGTPRSAGAGGSRSGAGGFTTGGAGLTGSRPGQRQRNDEEQESSGSARPDYLTEDEETWAARRRNAVPPVID